MTRTKRILLAVLSLLAVFPVSYSQNTSPYETRWNKDAWILSGSVAIAFTASAIDDSLTPLTPVEIASLNKNSIPIIDRWATNFYSESVSKTSDVLVGACIVAPIALMFVDANIGNDWKDISMMYVEVATLATFLPSFGKGGVQRIRPFAYNSNAPATRVFDADAKRSFFSGHTTWAFASMTFLATVYSDYYPNSQYKSAVWIASMSTASAVGLLRIFSGAHFPTEVLVGAAVGSAVGYMIPYLHRTNSAKLGLSQNPNSGGMQIAFSLPIN